jgi:hypothetical protein
MTADSLSALLRRADPAASPAILSSAEFSGAVHSRIRSVDTAPVSALANFARHIYPLAAALAFLASLAAGGSLAYSAHQRDRTDLFADAYARSIDPMLMHASQSAGIHLHR